MQVHIQNDGPVTLQIETPQFPPSKEVIVCHTLCMSASVAGLRLRNKCGPARLHDRTSEDKTEQRNST